MPDGNAPMMGDDNMPPMDNAAPVAPQQNDPNMPPIDGGNSDMGMMSDGDNPYDADFDAGVEANEEEDPKKFIQQLTGKLSQSLNKYQSELPRPDVELSKYVAGMILGQTTEGLSEEDANEILKKLTDKTDGKEGDMDNTNPVGNNAADGNGELPTGDNIPQNDPQMPNEGVERQTLNADSRDDSQNKIKPQEVSDVTYKKRPFTAPKFN